MNKYLPQMGKRCIEILKYFPPGELSAHNDDISYYTLSIVLESNYTGGELFVEEDTKIYEMTPPYLGGVIFRSRSTHGVKRMNEGVRKVLVVEYWDHADGDMYDERRDYAFTRDFLHLHPAAERSISLAIGFLLLYVVL